MVEIAYKLVGTGWAECVVRLNDSHAKLTASYLSDALGDMARAALELLRGSDFEHFSFEEEPGEYRWALKQFRPDQLSVRIVGFSELRISAPDDAGTILLRGSCSTREFSAAVATTLESVLSEYGESGYRRRWVEHPFPSEALRDLKASLRSLS